MRLARLILPLSLALLAFGALVLGNTMAGERAGEKEKKREPKKEVPGTGGKLEMVDGEKMTITISIFSRKDGEATDKTFPVAKDATITQDGVKTKLADLKKGFPAKLRFTADGKTVAAITVEGGTMQGQFKSANLERNTITVIAGRDMSEKVLHLTKSTQVILEGVKDAGIKDLKAGTMLVMTLSVEDRNTVLRIQTAAKRERERE